MKAHDLRRQTATEQDDYPKVTDPDDRKTDSIEILRQECPDVGRNSVKPEHAWDRIWTGANLLTLDDPHGLGERLDTVLAIKDGRIAWLGSREELAAIRWSARTII